MVKPPAQDGRDPIPIHGRAEENIDFIRRTMERAASFTAVPGWGNVAIGVVALAAGLLADGHWGTPAWVWTWVGGAGVAFAIAVVSMAFKARRAKVAVFGGAGARFWFGLLPPLAAGAFLTIPLYRAGMWGLISPVWLLLYGAGVTTGGAHSVRLVPLMGMCFMTAGVVAFMVPRPDITMAAAFGGLHAVFGYIIARRYGG
jgi:hypothetical protein